MVLFIVINKLFLGWWLLNMMFMLLVVVFVVWMFDMCKLWLVIGVCFVLVWGGVFGEYWWLVIGFCMCVWNY